MSKLALAFLALFIVFLIITLFALTSYMQARSNPRFHTGVDQFSILILLVITIIFLIAYLITRREK